MGLVARRKVTRRGAQGASNTLVIPKQLKAGKIATIAADRLMIVDIRGEIPEEDLLEFLERYVEPHFWSWLKEKQERRLGTGARD